MGLLDTHNLPFAAALIIMLALLVIQAVGLDEVAGAGDAEVTAAAEPNALSGLSTILGFGRIPFTVWLATFLLAFAGLGVGVQELALHLLGAPLGAMLAAGVAALGALPVTAAVVRPLAVILPTDETSAVSIDHLVGRRAHITEGVARHGAPARARVLDIHGHPHHVMVEPHEADSEIRASDEVLLVRRDKEIFYASALDMRVLSPD
jgi:hypothetical protein